MSTACDAYDIAKSEPPASRVVFCSSLFAQRAGLKAREQKKSWANPALCERRVLRMRGRSRAFPAARARWRNRRSVALPPWWLRRTSSPRSGRFSVSAVFSAASRFTSFMRVAIVASQYTILRCSRCGQRRFCRKVSAGKPLGGEGQAVHAFEPACRACEQPSCFVWFAAQVQLNGVQ